MIKRYGASVSPYETLVPFEVISSGCNALVVPFQHLVEGPIEVFLYECVNDLRQSLFHLLNCLITTASELGEWLKVTGSKVWTIGTLVNCLDAHLAQIVCYKDGVVDWCIVLVEMPLTRFEECWPLPKEPLPELPLNLNIVTLSLTFWSINSGVLTSLLLPHLSSSLTDYPAFLESLMPLKNWCSIHARCSKSSLKHFIRFCGIFSKFQTEFYCISFF